MTFAGRVIERDAFDRPAPAAALKLPMERRRGGRMKQRQAIAIYEPYASRFFGGETVDVSRAGMKIRLPAWVQLGVGRIVDLHATPDSAGLPLANRHRSLLCRVVWTRDDKRRKATLAGVEFLPAISAEAA